MEPALSQVLNDRFDPALAGKPYRDEEDYHTDLLARLTLYLLIGVLEQTGDKEGEGGYLGGVAMSAEEALDYLLGYPHTGNGPIPQLTALVAAADQYIASRLSAGEAAGFCPRLEHARRQLALGDFSMFCVTCALASALDRGFERVFTALHGDPELPFPTLGVARSLFCLAHPLPPEACRGMEEAASDENKLLFTAPPAEKQPLLHPLRLRPAALGYLRGQPNLSRALAACGGMLDTAAYAGDPLHIGDQLHRAGAVVDAICARDTPRLLILCGPPGSGKRHTLAHIRAERGAEFLCIRLGALPDPPDEVIGELAALALFWGYIPCCLMENPDTDETALLLRVLEALRPYRIGAVLHVKELRRNIVADGCLVTRVDYPLPALDTAVDLWRRFSAAYPVGSGVDWMGPASKYALTPGQILHALQAAADGARLGGVAIGEAEISAAIIQGNTGQLSKIADPIRVTFTWDDLVLGESSKQLLRDVCNRVKYRHLVETRWGFGAKSAYGNGISVLLYGPPGTGKTMSAQVVAGELGLPIYRINLAQIISKYIGETAKNLDAVFTEAKSSNVILFFDEADALFAKRTDVKNSNDRHANSESSYLLQKIEEYSGISILATNLANNFDEAFRRRINYMINIHMPSPAQRLQLWHNYLPEQAPLSPELDLKPFAENLELSGSVIKSAALQAAFYAADEGGRIGMPQIARAVRQELLKLGKSEPHFLTQYEG